MSYVSQALDTGRGQTFDYQLPVPLGSSDIRDFEARVHISGDDEVVAIVRDITERRAVERMKDEFISVVSHELLTPLTSIRGSLGLVASGMLGSLPEKGRHMLEMPFPTPTAWCASSTTSSISSAWSQARAPWRRRTAMPPI